MIEPLAESERFTLNYLRLKRSLDYDCLMIRIDCPPDSGEFPPDKTVAENNQRVHVLLVGLGSVGQAIVQQMAKLGIIAVGDKISIVDRDIETKWSSLAFSCRDRRLAGS